MADRPIQESDQDSPSYSPPPHHRPGWTGDGWRTSRGTSGRQGGTGGWAGTQPSPAEPGPALATTPSDQAHTSTRGGAFGMFGAAIVAAVLASLGTYGVLLATGQLDGQRATLSPPR